MVKKKKRWSWRDYGQPDQQCQVSSTEEFGIYILNNGKPIEYFMNSIIKFKFVNKNSYFAAQIIMKIKEDKKNLRDLEI